MNIDTDDEETGLINSQKPHPLSCCVVWTPIPLLSWICPSLGHIGVTDSHGITYDFEGPYYIGKGKMIFGDPRRKWPINVDPAIWDDAIHSTSRFFEHVNYNLLCSNCHYFAAAVLDKVDYPPIIPFTGKWTSGATVKIAYGMTLHGRSLSIIDSLIIWIPFLVFILFVLFIIKQI